MSVRNHDGYSLVEMVVAAGIFALAFVVIAAIFIGYSTAQGRAAIAQRLLNDGNYLMELVSREVRMNAIDYSCTAASPAIDHKYICLRSADGRAVHIRFDDAPSQLVLKICKDYSAAPCALASSNWTDLNTQSTLKITAVEFHSYPTVNPLGADVVSAQTYHPFTIVRMTVQGGRGKSQQTYSFQTAVSSRIYNF